MSRLLENRVRPCLVCCNTLALELLHAPTRAVAATSTQRGTMAKDAGSLFALLFRTASFPPHFVAPVRQMLPIPLQRMLRAMPPQHLPAFFRARAANAAAGQQQQQQQQPGAGIGGVEFLELSLSEYYFLSCAAFLLQQPDIHVQPAAANIAAAASGSRTGQPQPQAVDVPPSPEVYNRAFLQLLSQYLDFFVPRGGVHSSSFGKLAEQGAQPHTYARHTGAQLAKRRTHRCFCC
jgi:hypothetical protein